VEKDNGDNPVRYYDYLNLEKLLDSQRPKSRIGPTGEPAHHEMFFIIIHQVYELWFKCFLFELASVLKTFKNSPVDERDIGIIVLKLNRMIEVLKLLIAQIKVIETLTPLDFLDFRHLLEPASGYDSLQFRLIEVKLGLKPRWTLNKDKYGDNALALQHIERLKRAAEEEKETLFDSVESWLERTPFVLSYGSGDWFGNAFGEVAHVNIESIDLAIDGIKGIFDKKRYGEFLSQIRDELGVTVRKELSHQAFLAALFIHLYRDEPILQLPHRLLEALKEMDEFFSIWRSWHSSMVLRMIGKKPGTGGQSYDYLAQTAREYRFFPELDRVSTYLIPRNILPPLPKRLKDALDYHYSIWRREESSSA
jgi:tryptophan 2,3-dioxygenase